MFKELEEQADPEPLELKDEVWDPDGTLQEEKDGDENGAS